MARPELTLSPGDGFPLPLKFLKCQSRSGHQFFGATSEVVKDILATTAIGDSCGLPSRTATHRSPGLRCTPPLRNR